MDYKAIGATAGTSANEALRSVLDALHDHVEGIETDDLDPLVMQRLHQEASLLRAKIHEEAMQTESVRQCAPGTSAYSKALRSAADNLRKQPQWMTQFLPYKLVLATNKPSEEPLWPRAQTAFDEHAKGWPLYVNERDHVMAVLAAARSYLRYTDSADKWDLGKSLFLV